MQGMGESRRQFLKTIGLGATGIALAGTVQGQDTQPATQPQAGSAEIPRRAFGKTGLLVPEVCFGAMGIRPENANVLRAGVQQGLVMIDTAAGYAQGASERVVGEVIKAFGREKVLFHTKASGFDLSANQSAEQVEQNLRRVLEGSLQRLQTDHIDTYVLLHGTSDPERITNENLRAAAEKLKKEGKVRFIGISTHSNYSACCMAAINAGWYDFIMPLLTVANIDEGFLKTASENSGSQEAYEATARTGRGGRGGRRGRQMDDMREVLKAAQEKGLGILAMKTIANVPGGVKPVMREKYAPAGQELSDAQISCRVVMNHPAVSSVTIGIQSMKHLEEALALPAMKLAV